MRSTVTRVPATTGLPIITLGSETIISALIGHPPGGDSYRKARVPGLILCLDEARNCAEADVPPGALVVEFRRRVDPLTVLRAIGSAKQVVAK
jgi:hypothetical protein